MPLVWKRTFIDEDPECAAGARRRSHSEPRALPAGGPSFDQEREYVASLEALRSWIAGRTDDASSLQAPDSPPSPSAALADAKGAAKRPRVGSAGSAATSDTASSAGTAGPRAPTRGSLGSVGSHGAKASAPGRLSFSSDNADGDAASADSLDSDGVPSSPGRCEDAASGGGSARNRGSMGHPVLCKQPCIRFTHGTCSSGDQCEFCHEPHHERAAHLDKRHREIFKRLAFPERAALAMPIIHRLVSDLGLDGDVLCLLRQLGEVAQAAPPAGQRQRHVSGSLTMALAALKLRPLLLAVGKGRDAPEWLQPAALDDLFGSAQRRIARGPRS